jgi:riboflavin transporter FmnP
MSRIGKLFIPNFYSSLMKKINEITIVALFAAMSAVLELSPMKMVTQWGMKIDLVAIPILLAFFLFGFRVALETSIVMFFAISIISPTGFIGATMKWMATVPMFIVPTLMTLKFRGERELKQKLLTLSGILISLVALIALFGTLFVLLKDKEIISHLLVAISCITFYLSFWLLTRNYEFKRLGSFKNIYFITATLILAIIVRGITTTVINYYFAIPTFFGMSTEDAIRWIPWYIIIGLNAIQGIIDVGVAWTLAFKTGISKLFR